MRRLISGFAARTYHIVGNLMSWLNYYLNDVSYHASDHAANELEQVSFRI